MRIVTMTSDNFVACTRRMVESLRVWHPQAPVVVYALETGWGADQGRQFDGLEVEVRLLPEADVRHRAGANGEAVQNIHKLDVLLDQTEPFLYLDSDILVLKPLDEVWRQIERDGWVTAQEATPLERYYQGSIRRVTGLPAGGPQRSMNTGVVGCGGAAYRQVFALAREWSRRIDGIFLGDQGLVNLAWYKLYGAMPPDAGGLLNGGVAQDGTIDLRQTILHFARDLVELGGKTSHQARVWAAWPRGVPLVNFVDTECWRLSRPHPWSWLNQARLRRHRDKVAAIRQASLKLLGQPWLLVRDEDEAFLLDSRVLAWLDEFWEKERGRFAGVPHQPTYHLPAGKHRPAALSRRLRRTAWEVASRLH